LVALLAGAASASALNMTGNWVGYYDCEAGYCAGQKFEGTTTLVQAAGSQQVTGHNGGETESGTLVGHTFTFVTTSGSDESFTEVTISADGNSWTGHSHAKSGISGTVFAQREPPDRTVSGTVFGLSCSDTSCNESGLADQTILVQGKSAAGEAVAESAETDAEGKWSVVVPEGSYTAGTTFDGETIDGTGFEPEEASVAVGGQDVPGVNFKTCVAQAASASAARVGRAAMLRDTAHATESDVAPGYKYLCQTEYSFKVGAKIPLTDFVDPSSLAPYAVNADGAGYRDEANNTVRGPFYKKLPECARFDDERANPKPLKWSSYYRGTSSLGTAAVTLTWERNTQDVERNPTTTVPGSLTRVYQFERDGRKGTCSITRAVVPLVTVANEKIDGQPVSKSEGKFEIVVSWPMPFAPQGYVPPPDLKKVPGVATQVHHAVDAAAEKVPLWETYPKLVQAAIVAAVSEIVEHYSFHGIAHVVGHYAIPAAGVIVEMIEATIPVEKAYNLAVFAYNFIDGEAQKGLGYHPMNMVIRGSFGLRECPQVVAKSLHTCSATQLALDTTTDKFPDYSLSLTRSGKEVPTSSVLGVKHPQFVNSGGDTPLPGEVQMNPEIKSSKGGTLNQVEIWKDMRQPIQPGALEVAAGAVPEKFSGAFPTCGTANEPGTSETRCYLFGDGLP
jgi:hypothetical protein